MSKFNITVRAKGNGVHVGINVKHWQDFAAAIKVAATRVADLVYSGRFKPRAPAKPPEAVVAEQLTDEEMPKEESIG